MNWTLPLRTAYRLGRTSERLARRRIVELADGSTWAAIGRPGVSVRCLRGSLWLTQAGMPDDIVLSPGQTFTAMHRGKLVGTAFGRVVMEVAR